MFDINKFEDQEPDCFTNYELLNLSDLNQVELDELGLKSVHCDDENFARIAIIKWRLDNPLFWPYVNHIFEYIKTKGA